MRPVIETPTTEPTWPSEDEIMAATGTLYHCGLPMTYVSHDIRPLGRVEATKQVLRCEACSTEGILSLRTPLPPPARMGDYRDTVARRARALRKETTL